MGRGEGRAGRRPTAGAGARPARRGRPDRGRTSEAGPRVEVCRASARASRTPAGSGCGTGAPRFDRRGGYAEPGPLPDASHPAHAEELAELPAGRLPPGRPDGGGRAERGREVEPAGRPPLPPAGRLPGRGLPGRGRRPVRSVAGPLPGGPGRRPRPGDAAGRDGGWRRGPLRFLRSGLRGRAARSPPAGAEAGNGHGRRRGSSRPSHRGGPRRPGANDPDRPGTGEPESGIPGGRGLPALHPVCPPGSAPDPGTVRWRRRRRRSLRGRLPAPAGADSGEDPRAPAGTDPPGAAMRGAAVGGTGTDAGSGWVAGT